jgi:hypothetical protein
MNRWGNDYAANCNSDVDTWRIDPDHETSRGDDREALTELILKIGYPQPNPDASNGAIQRAAGANNESVWVLKALHQGNDPHLTLGFGGQVYHANVAAVPGPYLSITSISLAPGEAIAKGAASASWRK